MQICTGNETYDENLEAVFVSEFGEGFELVKVIFGRGQLEDNQYGPATPYNDPRSVHYSVNYYYNVII